MFIQESKNFRWKQKNLGLGGLGLPGRIFMEAEHGPLDDHFPLLTGDCPLP